MSSIGQHLTIYLKKDMKKDLHPKVNPVVFVDTSNGEEFVTTSVMKSKETKTINGVEHFVLKVEISSASHPFFTGTQKLLDTGGRLNKFNEKRAKAAAVKAKEAEELAEAA
jgi:large subunit ribosomal protein L31